MLKAGVSKVDITPREQIWLAGCGARTEPSQGVSQPLFTKVLALEDRGRQAVWVTADLLGYSKSMSDTLHARIKKKFGLDRDRVILNASHNHSGPVTGDLLHLYFDLTEQQYGVIDRYTKWLYDRIVEAVGLALADLAPAELAFGQGLAGFGVNRRRARDGGRCLPTVVDQDVPVLSIRSPKGRLRGVMFGYSCHTTCANDGTINGDWAGYAQAELEAKLPGSVAMYVAGCGGDVNPLPRWAPGLEQMYGKILSIAVEQVLVTNMARVDGPLRTAYDHAVIPFDPLPSERELRGLLKGRTGAAKREVEWQLALMRGGKDRRPRECYFPIHLWQFGTGMKLIGLSSEPVAEYAHRFKATYGHDDVWVSGYNDDFISYIPTLRVWREGGYEGTTGMMECDQPGPFAPAVEEVIAAKVDELWQATSENPRRRPRPSKHL